MAWQMQVEGMTEISDLLGKLEEKAPGVAAQALYDGAASMRGSLQQEVANIQTAPFKYASDGQTRLPSPEEKAILASAGIGVAKFDKNGSEVDTSVGFRNSGYAELAGKTVPIPKIANAINSGTSFMRKQPFARKAGKNGGNKAMEVMKTKIEEAFEAIIKDGGK